MYKKRIIIENEERRSRIPKERLVVMDAITTCFEELLNKIIRKNKIHLNLKKESYIVKDRYHEKYILIGNKNNETKRFVNCGVTYWEAFSDPKYNKMFSIDMSIDSEITFMLDYSIWILEYVYRNDPDFFGKLFHGKEDRLVKWSRGTDVQYYYYFFFHSKELEFVKYMIKEILQWLFARKEIIEVLKGERWIKGYIPPTPY